MPTRGNIQETDTAGVVASSLTLAAYTPSAGSNRVLEVMVAYGRSGVSVSCTATFGGVSMTSRGGQVQSAGTTSINVQAFTLNEADWPSTPADIVATLNGNGGIRIIASTMTDVDQTTPMDATPVTLTANNTNPWSLPITTVSNNALVSAFGAGNDPRTVSSLGAGQDQMRLDTDTVEVGAIDILRTLLWEDAIVPSAGPVTMTATWSLAHGRLAVVALAYRPFLYGPTIDTQPTAQTARVNGDTTNTATFTCAATGTGTVTNTAEIESSVGSGTYGTLANGSGATWTGLTASGSGSASTSLVGTFTAKTLSGRKIRIKSSDTNGDTYSDAVVLTVLDGPVLSASSATTNGSGQVAPTMTSDDALTANGEILLGTMSDANGNVIARTTVRPA